MKRLSIVLSLGLLVGLIAGAPAADAKRQARPVPTQFFLHGTQQAGEAQMNETWLDGITMGMDKTKPAAGAPKSMFVTNYVAGPNTACSGNGILPVWKGTAIGQVRGTVTVTLNTIATPATRLNVELFPDGTGGCDSDLGSTGYVPPVAAQAVEVTPGPGVTTVTFKNVNFKMQAWLLLQLSIADGPHPGQVRVLYDSADYASSVKFSLSK